MLRSCYDLEFGLDQVFFQVKVLKTINQNLGNISSSNPKKLFPLALIFLN